MNLEEAVKTLNRLHHRGWGDWTVDRGGDWPIVCVFGFVTHKLTEFEAIAIAEKLVEKEKAENPPPSIERLAITSLQSDVTIIKKRLDQHDTSQAFTQKYAENLEARVDIELNAIHNRTTSLVFHGHKNCVAKKDLESLVREILKDAAVVIPEGK
jgi:hypothetical protein